MCFYNKKIKFLLYLFISLGFLSSAETAFGWPAEKVGFINLTEYPIWVYYTGSHCVDYFDHNNAKGYLMNAWNSGLQNYTLVSFNFQNDSPGHHRTCSGIKKWIVWDISIRVNNQMFDIGDVTYKTSLTWPKGKAHLVWGRFLSLQPKNSRKLTFTTTACDLQLATARKCIIVEHKS